MTQSAAIAKQAHIARHLAVDDDEVGETTVLNRAGLSGEPQGKGIGAGRGGNRLQGRQADVIDEYFQFTVMPVAIGRDGKARLSTA